MKTIHRRLAAIMAMIALSAAGTHAGEEIMAMAPGAGWAANSADAINKTASETAQKQDLQQNVIKLTLPSPSERKTRSVEVDPARPGSGGFIDFDVTDALKSFIPAPPGSRAKPRTDPEPEIPMIIPKGTMPSLRPPGMNADDDALPKKTSAKITLKSALPKPAPMPHPPAVDGGLMAMAPPLPEIGDPYVDTLEPFRPDPEPSLPQPRPLSAPPPIASASGKNASFHSRPPKPAHIELLPIPAVSAVPAAPAARRTPATPSALAASTSLGKSSLTPPPRSPTAAKPAPKPAIKPVIQPAAKPVVRNIPAAVPAAKPVEPVFTASNYAPPEYVATGYSLSGGTTPDLIVPAVAAATPTPYHASPEAMSFAAVPGVVYSAPPSYSAHSAFDSAYDFTSGPVMTPPGFATAPANTLMPVSSTIPPPAPANNGGSGPLLLPIPPMATGGGDAPLVGSIAAGSAMPAPFDHMSPGHMSPGHAPLGIRDTAAAYRHDPEPSPMPGPGMTISPAIKLPAALTPAEFAALEEVGFPAQPRPGARRRAPEPEEEIAPAAPVKKAPPKRRWFGGRAKTEPEPPPPAKTTGAKKKAPVEGFTNMRNQLVGPPDPKLFSTR